MVSSAIPSGIHANCRRPISADSRQVGHNMSKQGGGGGCEGHVTSFNYRAHSKHCCDLHTHMFVARGGTANYHFDGTWMDGADVR